MRLSKKIVCSLFLSPVLVIVPTCLTSCGCNANNDEFNTLIYGQKSPEINKNTKAKALNIAIRHFEEQFPIDKYGPEITVEEFNSDFLSREITCNEYYWNLIYNFANICADNNVYQIIDWNNNNQKDKSVTNSIKLRNRNGEYTLAAHPDDVFKYSYNDVGTIIITLANDNTYTIPSYYGASVKVIK